MNFNRTFKLKVEEDKIGPYLIISPKLMDVLKLKESSKVTARVVSNKGKLVLEITPN